MVSVGLLDVRMIAFFRSTNACDTDRTQLGVRTSNSREPQFPKHHLVLHWRCQSSLFFKSKFVGDS